jgi:hypothetical protein
MTISYHLRLLNKNYYKMKCLFNVLVKLGTPNVYRIRGCGKMEKVKRRSLGNYFSLTQ